MLSTMVARGLRILALMVASLGFVADQAVWAQDGYPSRDVRVIVPFAAGGGTDLVTRLFSQKLSEKFGKTFYVENRAGGAGGIVGSLVLSRSTPDGYTVGAGTSSGIQTAAIDSTDYNPLRDLEPISRFGAGIIVLIANPKIPVKTLPEFIAYAKQHPGLTYGSSGVGSTTHITGEMLAKDAGVVLKHVPYRGEGAALSDVLSGQISLLFISLTASKSQIEAGGVRALAVTSARRASDLPGVPTMVESGYKDFVVDAWYGLYAPKGTPQSIIDALVKGVNEIRADPGVSTKLMQQLNFDTSGSDSPKEFRSFMESELERYTAVAISAGLKKN